MEEQKLDILIASPASVLRSPTREPLVPAGGDDELRPRRESELAAGLESPSLTGRRHRRRRDDRFGLLCFQPEWLQVLRNAKFFTLLLCLFSLVEGAIISGNASGKYA